MKKKILVIFILYLIMSIFLYPLRESIWYHLFYTIAYMIAVVIYFALTEHLPCEIVPRSVALTCLYLSISISSVFKFFCSSPISFGGY